MDSLTEVSPAKKLPKFLLISIGALVALTLFTIVALFLEGVEQRGGRIFLTFVVFGAFVGLTALDSSLGARREWYAPAALVSNSIFLAASLLTVWLGSRSSYFDLVVPLLFSIVAMALVLRAGLLVAMLAMGAVDRSPRRLESVELKSAYAAAWLANLAAAVYVAYMAVQIAFSPSSPEAEIFWDVYLKIGTALLILSGLGLSITLLLRWHGTAQLRTVSPTASVANAAGLASSEPTSPSEAASIGSVRLQEESQLRPWPLFADGSPYPAGADGQPDFAAVEQQTRRVQSSES